MHGVHLHRKSLQGADIAVSCMTLITTIQTVRTCADCSMTSPGHTNTEGQLGRNVMSVVRTGFALCNCYEGPHDVITVSQM